MKQHRVKLRDLFEDEKTGTYARVAELSVNGNSVDRLVKVSSQNIDAKLSVPLRPINEVILSLKFSDIREMDNDNDKRDLFIRAMLSKTRQGKINLPFIALEYQKPPTGAEIEQALTFLVDIIYNNERIDVAVPPKIVLPEAIKEKAPDSYQKHFEALVGIMETYSKKVKPACFIPAYVTRSKIPKIIELYSARFGPEALLILDVAGARFEGGASSIVSQVMFNMNARAKTEDYAIYLFNHKSRKRSGREVPSEDLLALLRGASFVGPSHVRLKLPKNVVSGPGKVFNEGDFLYYPEDTAPNIHELNDFSGGTVKATSLNKFNDLKVNVSAINLSKDPVSTVSGLKRPEFKDALASISKRMNRFLAQRAIDDFF